MVAIVSGARLGLELGSLATLGAAGPAGNAAAGRNGQGVYVNLASGNLVLQQRDDLLVARGQDAVALRTYNSRGALDDDNGDNWTSAAESVRLAGTLNAAGSSMERTGRDGSVASYAFDSARGLYVSTDGAGAYDTLRYVAADDQLEWRDGASGLTQRYESGPAGRLLSSRDPSGNALSYGYGANGFLSAVTTATGEGTYYDYAGSNLSQLRTVAGGTTTRVRYAYDASNRLASVTVDLSPADNTVADGRTYQTSYTYDGSSRRVASITQTDGSRLTFSYLDAGNGVFMVRSVTDALNRTTTYTYGLASPGVASYAVVTDPQGLNTRYDFDASGQVTAITAPAVNGQVATRQFTYTAAGDVASVTDGEGRTTVFQYDANGNQVLQRDAAGDTVTRSYDARNQLVTETAYAVADPDGAGAAAPATPLTTRYVYDAGGANLLRFVLSPDGRVTEHRYNALGDRITTIVYAGTAYAVAGLAPTTVPTEATMAAWAATAANAGNAANQRTDMVCDARGQLQQRTRYAKVDASGVGIVDGSEAVERFVYDAAGLLLQSVSANNGVTSYTYDGLGRVLTATDALGHVTTTQYSDAAARTAVTQANGLVTTRSFDLAGRLVSVLESPTVLPGETRYFYDSLGRLRMTQDASGVRTWRLYDEEGRLAADVDATGSMTEYSYDRSDRVVRTMHWGQAVNTAALVDAAGQPVTTVTVASIRPAASASDGATWMQYDPAGRLVRQAQSVGTGTQAAVTETRYDGASRPVQVIRYATTVPADGTAGAVQPGNVPLPAASAQDRVTRNFHDGAGHLTGALDAEGFLTAYVYNAAGLLGQTVRYANATTESLRATGTFAQLTPAASGSDIRTVTLYDGQGQAIAEVDGENYLTESVHDGDGNVTQTIRYANRIVGSATPTSTLSALRPAANANDRVTTREYDALDRLLKETSPEGVVTQYAYDDMGRLVSTVRAAGSTEARGLLARYDLQGRLTGELSAEGAALLTGGQTQAQVDAIWSQYATTYTYDAAGRRTSLRDAAGNTTWFYYDGDGALRYTTNALGEVRENRYDARGRLTQQIAYATRSGIAGPGGVIAGTLSIPASPAQDTVTTYTYTDDGQVAGVKDAEGNLRTHDYNAFGEEVASAEPVGSGLTLARSYTVDRRGLRVATVSDPAGVNATESTTYDAFGRVLRQVDAKGNVREQAYDRLGRVVSTKDALGATRTTTYDAFARKLVERDAKGNATSYAYDAAARAVTVSTPEGVRITTTNNRHGQVQSVLDGRGNVTSYTYDADGRLLRVTTPLGETGSSYDAAGRLLETTDRDGNQVAYTYDAANRVLTRRVDPLGLNLATTYQYDGKGQALSVVDPNGVTTAYQYDRNGRVLTQTVDPAGLRLQTTYRYDGKGNVLTVTSPGGTPTQYVYDALGRRTQETLMGSDVTLRRSWTYDAKGNVTASTDAAGAVTRYAYDAEDRLVFTLDPTGALQQLAYDAEGRVVKKVSYAGPIDTTGLPTAPTVADLQARVVAQPGLDEVEQRVYDRDGRMTATVDGTGGVVRYTYDANGNVVLRTAYANRINLATWTPGTLPAPAGDNAHDARTFTVYDALDRAVYTMDGTGAVTWQRYDGNGNVLERVAYAKQVPTSTPLTESGMAAAVALVADPARDAAVRNTYDAAGRLTWSVDGTGAVTQRVYDRNGNLVQEIARATALPAGADPASVPASDADRVTSRAYDSANRMVFEVDALNFVTEQAFDAEGHLTLRTLYDKPLTSPPTLGQSSTVANIRTALKATAGADRTTRHGYDAAGREVVTIAADGAARQTQYDGAGRPIARVAYFKVVSTTGLAATASGSTLASRLVTDPKDRRTQSSYDAAGRLTAEIDPLGAATTRKYDGVGRLTELHRPDDRVETTQYDAAGARTAVTDALGQVESHAYDGAGRELRFTNKAGAVWTYDHDAAGRTTRETSPQVKLTATTLSAGTVVAGATASASVVTVLAYDALGRLTQRTEAYGRAGEQRTTRYEYDAAGRQVHVIYPAVGVYNASADAVTTNGATGTATRVDVSRSLETRTFYDTLGNAVANRDVGGGLTQKAYDRAGHVLYEIDALGYVTGYTRNAFGHVTSLTRYASQSALALRSVADATQAATGGEVQAVLASPDFSHAGDRTVVTVYDVMGRVVETRQPTAFVYDASSGTSFSAAARVRTTYDTFGEAIQVGTARDATGTAWFTTTHYFDAGGREVDTVDAMGYRTTRSYDCVGNLTRVTEYAQALAPNSWTVGAAPDPVASSDDRTTLYAYDLLDRKITETRQGVDYVDANGANAHGDLSTQYAYDAVGNQTSVQDALQNTTLTSYDALGRIKAVLKPQGSGTVDATGAPMTEYFRDAYGNVVLQVEYANGGTGTTADSIAAVAADTSRDLRTLTHYDVLGHALETTDANNATSYVSYDAYGHAAKTWQTVTEGSVKRTAFQVNEYDALGQLVQTRTPASTNVVRNGVTASYVPGQVVDGQLATANKLTLGWSSIVDPAGGTVRVEVDCLTTSTLVYDNGELIGGEASHLESATQEFTASAAAGGATVSWLVRTDSIAMIRVFQSAGGQWVSKWEGTMANANGSGMVTLTQDQAGVVYTTQEFNAFGEMTRRGSQGGRQEYFDYDGAGRLWRTNTGDGVDLIRLYDLQGNVTSEIRSSGVGGSNADLKAFASADSAAANPYMRRVDIQYDAIGHVTQRTEAARADVQDGVSVQRQYVGTTVQSATCSTNQWGVSWYGNNQATLSWNNLSALGSGDLKVTLKYRTPLVQQGGYWDPDTGGTVPITYTGGTARQYQSSMLVGDANATGTTLSWRETSTTEDGGIGDVTWVTVQKKDLNGNWVTVIDQDPGYGPNEIDVGAPPDTRAAVQLEMRAAGTTNAFAAVQLASFGNAYRYDARSLAVGNYDYRVTVTPSGEATTEIANGTVSITLPPLNTITTAISYGKAAAGTLAWQAPSISTQQVFNYRLSGTTNTWASLPVTTWTPYFSTTQLSGVDTSKLPAGTYAFELLYSASGAGVPGSHATGTFTIVAGSPPQYSVAVNSVPPSTAISTLDGSLLSGTEGLDGFNRTMRPVTTQATDRWGNVLQAGDPRNAAWVTTYKYNAANQLVRQTQPSAGAGAPVTTISYDALGRQVAVRDALQHVNGQVFDALGQLVQEKHADGGQVTYRYDIFGRKVSQTLDEGSPEAKTTLFTYDKLGRLLSTDKGQAEVYTTTTSNAVQDLGAKRLVDKWTYDELGHKLTYTNGNGEQLSYSYDLRGNVVQVTQPGLQKTRAAFDAQGHKIAELDANAYATSWSYDYFGRLTDHTDLGGARYAYTYDNAAQLTLQTNTRNQRLEYRYDAVGQLATVTDRADAKVTSYLYDEAGRHVRERVQQAGITYQDNHLGYDALGNLRDVADSRAHVILAYDLAGNRTVITTAVDYQGINGEASSTSTRYFLYDEMNRQKVVDGVDAAGNISDKQGHKLTYDHGGNRTSDTFWGTKVVATDTTQQIAYFTADGIAYYTKPTTTYTKTQGYVLEQYKYDALNRLVDVERDGTQIDLRWYDGADRVVHSGPKNLPTGYTTALTDGTAPELSNGAEIRINRYDANGRLLHQRVQRSDETEKAKVSWDPNENITGVPGYVAAGYDGVGNALGYVAWDQASGAVTKYTNTLARYEAHQAASTSAVCTIAAPGSSSQGYDANGFLVSYTDSTQSANSRKFVNDASGRALYVEQAGNVQRQLIVNGEVLGIYGAGVDPVKPSSGGNPNFANLADFNFGFASISARYPNASPGAYTIHAGDTLQTIAKAAYGDSALWYRIAEANGLAGNNDLKVGQTLTIPNAVTTIHNDRDTFKPYDPSRVTGDMSPNLAAPGDDGCGAVGKLLMVIVAVVVTIYTAGAFAAEAAGMSAGSGTFAMGMDALAEGTLGFVPGAVSAAAGSIAGQAAGLATGTIQRFSWKEVGLAAVSGGVSGSLPTASFGKDLAGYVGRALTTNVLSQGISVATGLQHSFDWRGVAAAGAGAAAGYAVGKGLQEIPSELLRRGLSGFAAGAVTAALRGRRVDVQQVAVDAFGNALGEGLASGASGTRTAQSGDPLGDFIDKNMPTWEQRQANVDQVLEIFGRAGGDYRYPATQVAGGPSGAQPDENIARMLRLANEPGAVGGRLPFRAEVTGGWSRDFQLDDGTPVLKFSDEALDPRRLIPGLSHDAEIPQLPGYRVDSIEWEGAAKNAFYIRVPREMPVVEEASTSTLNFQEINDQRVIAGTYDRLSQIGQAWSSGNWGDMWRHITFEASPHARDIALQRSFPAPHPDLARIQRMADSPLGTIASGIGRLLGANQQGQDALLVTGGFLERLGGAASQVYKQTLTAPPPISGSLAARARATANPLDVGSYAKQSARSVRDGMSPDHIPSFAAIRMHVERTLNRRLTPQEAAELRNGTTTLMVDTGIHQQVSRTYGGRNTPAQIARDSLDLQAAAIRDQAVYRQALRARGYSDQQIDAAFENIHAGNREKGWY